MADKCIGNLTLNIKDIQSKVDAINKALSSIGKDTKVKINIADEVKKQIDKVFNEIVEGANKISTAATKVTESMNRIGTKSKGKSDLEEYVKILKEYHTYLDKAAKATQNGDTVSANYYQQQAAGHRELIQVMKEENAELLKQATLTDTVIASKEKLALTKSRGEARDESSAIKEQNAAVKEYADSLVALYTKQAELNNSVASGQVQKGTAEYAEMQAQIKELADKCAEAAARLQEMGVDAQSSVEGISKVQTALKGVAESERALAGSNENGSFLSQAKQQYFELTDAIKNYNAAMKSGDTDGMANAQVRIDAAMQEVSAIQQAVAASDMEASAKQQVLNYIQQCNTAQAQHTAEVQRSASASSEMESAITSVVSRMFSLMAVIRTVSSLFEKMVDYVSEYSDKMSEIQMITMKSDSQIEELGKQYRQIAQDMSVSSLEMADAAIYFTRQGLGAEQIEDRLRNTTQYAKAANLEFETAAELITAVVNSMNLMEQEAEDGRSAAQRVADVFLIVGDNAATSGAEIGEAMQKAAAAAGTFGVEFEWLAASIAAVSETTRQDARTIGTAFNTMIARLHQIKQTGYNSEDETKINDIAKALSKIDVALMDNEGNWRDYQDIMTDVAEKWDELDDKTKSYIATTMAGVRQQNVFLAWMNDMSKGAEDGSRTLELYDKAMDSVGIASQKYGVYLDSVAASQERLTVAQENFYSVLDENVIKGWNNALAGFVNMIAEGAQATSGWSVVLPALAVAITGVAIALVQAGGAAAAFSSLMSSNPILLTIAAIVAGTVALVTAVNAVISAVNGFAEAQKEVYKASDENLKDSQKNIQSYQSIKTEMNSMFDALSNNNGKLEDYNELLDRVASLSPTAASTVQQLKDGLIDQTTAAEKLNAELEKLIDNEKQVSLVSLRNKYETWSPSIAGGSVVGEWGMEDLENTEAFIKKLKKAWAEGDTKLLTKEMSEDIKTYLYSHADDDQDAVWNNIAATIWEKYFFGEIGKDGMKAKMSADIDDMIKDVVSTIATNQSLSNIEQGFLRKQLFEMIWGDDRDLTTQEYQNAGKVIEKFVAQIISDGFSIRPEDMVEYVGTSLFGNSFLELFGEQLDQLKQSSEFEEYSREVASIYDELMSMGFSSIEIDELYSSLPLEDWDKAIDAMADRLKSQFKKAFGDDFLGIEEINIEDGTKEFVSMLDELDLSTLKLIDDLTSAGVSFSDIQDLFIGSADMEDFIAKLQELAQNSNLEDLGDGAEEAVVGIKDFLKAIQQASKEIETYDKLLKSIDEGEKISFTDIMDLAADHPEIMASINDINSLRQAIADLRTAASKGVVDSVREIYKGSTEAMMSSPFASYMKEGGPQTMRELYNQTDDAALKAQIDKYIDTVTASFLAQTDQLGNVGRDILGQWMTSMFDSSNVDLLKRPILELGDDIATLLSETHLAGSQEFRWTQDIVIDLTPITPDGEVLSEDYIKHYIDDLLEHSVSIEDIFENDKIENGGRGILINITAATDGFDAAISDSERLMQVLHLLQGAYYGVQEAEKTWLEQQAEKYESQMDLNWAKTNAFKDQLDELASALQEGGAESFMNVWNSYSEEMKSALLDEYQDLARVFADVENALNEQKQAIQEAGEEYEKYSELLRNSTDASEEVYDAQTRLKTVLEEMQDVRYEDIYDIQSALEDGGIEAAIAQWESLDQITRDVISFNYPELYAAIMAAKEALEEEARATAELNEYGEQHEEGIDAIADAQEKLAEASAEATQALGDEQRLLDAKHFTETAKAIKQLREGTITVAQAYEIYAKDLDKAKKAQEDVTKASEKLSKGTKLVKDDVTNLAALLGKSADEIIADFPAALEEFNNIISAVGELQDVINALNKEAFIKITGTSDCDFSALQNGLISCENLAQEVIDALVATGQWEVETIDLPQEGFVFNPIDGSWSKSTITAHAQVLKPSSSNPMATQSEIDTPKKGGGGGGGGGGNQSTIDPKAQGIIDALEQIKKYQDAQIDYYEALAKYYDSQGLSQSVIAAYEKEIQLLKEQSKEYDKSLAKIEEIIAEKKKQLAATTEGSASYEALKKEIQELTEKYMAMKSAAVSVQSTIQGLTDSIKKQRDAVRDYTAQIKQLIYQAISDREARKESMFEGSLTVEKTIMEMMKTGYDVKQPKTTLGGTSSGGGGGGGEDTASKELERQIKALKEQEKQIQKNAKARLDALKDECDAFQKANKAAQDGLQKQYEQYNKLAKQKIEALNEEKSLLSEQLNIRKQQNEAEDKQAKLKKLEIQYQRIIADPTRQKEALKLAEEIAKLREDMAWDTAEAEVKSKQEALDNEKEGIEKNLALYKESYEDQKDALKQELEAYKQAYEEKKKLMEEERDAMIAAIDLQIEKLEELLAQQREAYSAMSSAASTSTSEITKTSRSMMDDVSKIMGMTDKEIIKWMKQHSEDYQKATDLERKKMVKDWQKMLDQMRGKTTDYWAEVEKIFGGGDSAILKFLRENLDDYRTAGKEQAEALLAGWMEILEKLKQAVADAVGDVTSAISGNGMPSSNSHTVPGNALTPAKVDAFFKNVTQYDTGGLATSTGPAWLDGTLSSPERVLSPYQTELFETMVEALERVSTVSTPAIPNHVAGMDTSGSRVSVGDIIVNVDNLDTDDDYEELAKKVGDILMDRIGRRAVVGGIRFGGF